MTAVLMRWVNIFVCVCVLLVLFLLLLPPLEQSRQAARQSQSQNNLKQFGLALHNYHDVHNVFPPGGVVNVNDVAFHGWITQLIPYLECSNLYNQIDMNLPWDHPVNRHLFQAALPPMLNPNIDVDSTSEGFGLTHYTANQNVLFRNSSTQFSDIHGGAEHCWMLADATGEFRSWGDAFNWRDWNGTLYETPADLGIQAQKSCLFLLADGSVRPVNNAIAPRVFKEFSAAIPTASPEATRKPDYLYQTQHRVPKPRSLTLAGSPHDGGCPLSLEIYSGADGHPETAVILGCQHKGGDTSRDVTSDDLMMIVKHCRDVKIVQAGLTLDAAACATLAQLPRLETLVVAAVDPAEDVLTRLAEMKHLRCIAVRNHDETLLEKLRTSLPTIQILRR